jgi:periplasmic protein TonB
VIYRLAPALLVGVLVTLGLFWLMQFMITESSTPIEKTQSLKRVEFVRLKREPPPPEKKKRPKKPEKVEAVKEPPKKKIQKKPTPKKRLAKPVKKRVVPAEAPRTKAAGSGAPIHAQKNLTREGGLTADRRAKAKTTKPGPTVPARVKASRGLVPLLRVPPKYPRRAAQRGVEGWVKVQFVITVTGRVKDAKVVGSSPSGVFDRAALKAISKWKFKPKVIKGQRVEQLAVQKLQFKLKKRRR